jgi:MraZ protein
MANFIGTYEHTLDAKNRVIVPMKLREAISEEVEGAGFYLTRGLDECIWTFTPRGWREARERFEGASVANPKARYFNLLFFSQAAHANVDSQGRIVIPDRLKTYAKLKKDVVVVGNGSRIEIWNSKTWADFIAKLEPDYQRFAEEAFP